MTIRTVAEVYAEFEEAIRWYEDQQPGLGREFSAEVRRAFDNIVARPLSHPMAWRSPPFRACLLRKFPYRVVFGVYPGELVVLAIAHTSRRPNYWRKRG